MAYYSSVIKVWDISAATGEMGYNRKGRGEVKECWEYHA
jgi:hypothetical protein